MIRLAVCLIILGVICQPFKTDAFKDLMKVKEILQKQKKDDYKKIYVPYTKEDIEFMQAEYLAHDKCFTCNYPYDKDTDPNLY